MCPSLAVCQTSSITWCAGLPTASLRALQLEKTGKITKPIIAWCVGTCASCFATEVQFGHAGAQARGDLETAAAKNKAMKDAGLIVPDSFDKIPETLANLYQKLVIEGDIV